MTSHLVSVAGRRRAGLTLIELMISMVVGLVVISTVTAYVRTTDRNITGAYEREDYNRKARFLGIALRRDIGEAGVALSSTPVFGSVAVFNDTVVVLKVPFEFPAAGPLQDPAYRIALNPNPPTTTIGTTNSATNCNLNTCVRLHRVTSTTGLTLVSGMLAVLTQGQTRRLIIANVVNTASPADSSSVTFRNTAAVLHHPSITSAAPITGITTTNTTVQRVDMIAYWRDAQNNLWRATRMDPATGNLVGEIVTTGCTAFTARIVYQDGTTSSAAGADSTVAGHTYSNINAVLITATLKSDIADTRINGGVALGRTYTFRVQPRNLLYERNRGA